MQQQLDADELSLVSKEDQETIVVWEKAQGIQAEWAAQDHMRSPWRDRRPRIREGGDQQA